VEEWKANLEKGMSRPSGISVTQTKRINISLEVKSAMAIELKTVKVATENVTMQGPILEEAAGDLERQ
jgi:hypothetical protein